MHPGKNGEASYEISTFLQLLFSSGVIYLIFFFHPWPPLRLPFQLVGVPSPTGSRCGNDEANRPFNSASPPLSGGE